MKPLYSQIEFDTAIGTHKLPIECLGCNQTFYKTKSSIKRSLNKNNGNSYCSLHCLKKYRNRLKTVSLKCTRCDTPFKKQLSQLKSKNHFCSQSCATTYNNQNKTHGNRRSKLEIFLQERLTSLYPDLDIHYNRKDAINSELDIYIPSLKLAFELNGIFHYEPIFGTEKLDQIRNNDSRKFQACIENQISLCIIDVSTFTYFKEQNANKFLTIIKNIITPVYP